MTAATPPPADPDRCDRHGGPAAGPPDEELPCTCGGHRPANAVVRLHHFAALVRAMRGLQTRWYAGDVTKFMFLETLRAERAVDRALAELDDGDP